MIKLQRKYIYYLIQLICWMLVWIHQAVILLVLNHYSFLRNIIIAISVFFTFLLTHFYRWIYKKKHFNLFSLKKQFIIGFLFILLCATFSALVSSYLSIYLLYKKKILLINISFFAIISTWGILYTIWVFTYHLFHFFEDLKKQKVKSFQQEQIYQNASDEVFKLQLEPHFLFNALNTIRSLLLSNVDKAKQGNKILSHLLLHGYLKTGFDLIKIEEELNIVSEYLDLEKLRFGDKIKFTQDIQQECLLDKIPAGLLLTLVENAVKHGFKQRKSNFIETVVLKNKDSLHLKVINSGQIIEQKDTHPSGLGFVNVKKRLEKYFPHQFSLALQNFSEDSVGVEVVIHQL